MTQHYCYYFGHLSLNEVSFCLHKSFKICKPETTCSFIRRKSKKFKASELLLKMLIHLQYTLNCQGHRTQMQGQFKSKNVYFQKAGWGSPHRAKQRLWNTWALSSINMAGEIAAMKNNQNQNLSTLGGKHKCYERITRKTHALLMRRI